MGNICSWSNKSQYLPIGENSNYYSTSDGLDYPPCEEKNILNFRDLQKDNTLSSTDTRRRNRDRL